MTQEKFEKAKEIQEQIAKVTEEINGSYLPDGFKYIGASIEYRVRNINGDIVKFHLLIPRDIIEATIHEVRDFHIEKQAELTKQFAAL